MKNVKKISVMLLLAVVAVGAYFVSGTYAKYTSTISGTSTAASVAKWAWEVNSQTFTTAASVSTPFTFDLFGTILDTNGGAAETDVHAAKIAPGTKGQITLDITNNSEVNATYAVAFTETNAGNIPIEYSLTGAADSWTADITTLNIAATAIAMDGGTATQNTLYWRWAFEGSDSENYTSTQTDVTDTALGFAANTSAATVQVTATVTLTQVD